MQINGNPHIAIATTGEISWRMWSIFLCRTTAPVHRTTYFVHVEIKTDYGSHATAFGRYISVTLLSFAVNIAAFNTLTDRAHISPLVAQAIAIVVAFVFNFGLNSLYSFAGPKSRGE